MQNQNYGITVHRLGYLLAIPLCYTPLCLGFTVLCTKTLPSRQMSPDFDLLCVLYQLCMETLENHAIQSFNLEIPENQTATPFGSSNQSSTPWKFLKTTGTPWETPENPQRCVALHTIIIQIPWKPLKTTAKLEKINPAHLPGNS